MTASLRRLGPGEIDPELLGLGASAGALAYGGVWLAAGLPLPPCLFRAVTGCPCPACGATRCVLALLHGHMAEAAACNPLILAGLTALALLNLYAAAVLLGHLPRLRLSFGNTEARIFQTAFVILITANWTYEIHRAGF
jgi:hypothetical protein